MKRFTAALHWSD